MARGGLNWERANRNEARQRDLRNAPKRFTGADRQAALADFVAKNSLRCFKCKAARAEWASTGISKRGPWAICAPCVQSREGAKGKK
jgi:hypothetical protein